MDVTHLLLWLFVAPVWCQSNDTTSATTSMVATLSTSTSTAPTSTAPTSTASTSTASTSTTLTIPATMPTINCSVWEVTNTTIQGFVLGSFNNATATSESVTVYGVLTNNTVSFQNLEPGCMYALAILSNSETLCNNSKATVAEPVSDIQMSPVNSTSLSVSWNDAQGCVRQYIVRLNNSENSTTTNYTEFHDLVSGCSYTVNITTVGEGDYSAFATGQGATVAAPVSDVTVNSENSTSLSVSWTKALGCVKEYIVHLTKGNATMENYNYTDGTTNYTEFHNLDPGCFYTVNITTVGEGNYPAFATEQGSTVTASVRNMTVTAENTTTLSVKWDQVPGCVKEYLVTVNNTDKRTNTTSVQFSDLLPGHNYTVNITVEADGGRSPAQLETANTYPANLNNVICGYAMSGYSIALSWPRPPGAWTRIEVRVGSVRTENLTGTETSIVVNGVQPAQVYPIILTSYSGTLSSSPITIHCTTDPRGVITGSVTAVLLLILVILVVVFVLRHKPDLFSQRFSAKSQGAGSKFKPVPVHQFPAHFQALSCDQNRGFSVEYEDLCAVGLEQTCKAALIPDNKAKNRFTNVLPYDWSRVKLTTVDRDVNSDYINANYMPGYGTNAQQYIAAQGPLEATVLDFWRMIWEKGVRGVVMVTNCIEGGKVKCEQYWPLDYTPCTYGHLSVLVIAEHKEKHWIVREFEVTNRMTLEVRSVTHFHFTAWPDHGVPDSTSALLEFRGLVRNHIESYTSSGPTVVHCSAGVGRTGTLIALDVALQQLQNEKVVGLAGIVHRMRLHRTLMVQTESQYIFLHQCIMDRLNEDKVKEQPLYENTDLLYVNATALRELQSSQKH